MGRVSIDKHRNRSSGDAGHYEVYESLRKVEVDESISYKGPFQPIESLLEINFQDHVGFLSFHFPKVSDVFLDNNSIICSSSIIKEASLGRSNDNIKKRFDPIHYDFGDDFIGEVTESNWSIISY